MSFLQFFPIAAGMTPAPAINFAAMGTLITPDGQRLWAYLNWKNGIGNPGWNWLYGPQGVPANFAGPDNVDLGDLPPNGGIAPNGFTAAYEFGRPGSPQQGWVRTQQGWYTGYPVDSYGYPVTADGRPIPVTNTNQPVPFGGGNNPFGGNQGGGMPQGGNVQNSLLKQILVDAPVITKLQAALTGIASDVAGAAAITDTNPFFDALFVATAKFIGAQAYIGSLDFEQLIANPSGSDLIFIMNATQLGPAATAFQVANSRAASDNIADAIAGATVAVTAPIVATWVDAFGSFATATGGIAAALGAGAANNNLAFALLLGGGGNAALPKGLILQAMLLGPAITAFSDACRTAKTALNAAANIGDVKTAYADWNAAAQTYLAAVAQAELLGAIGN